MSSPNSTAGTLGAIHNGIGELPIQFDRGLAALGLVSMVSTISTVGLISFMVQRMVRWRSYYKSTLVYNQYIILILGLLVADFFYALPLSTSWYWYSRKEVGTIPSDSHVCHAQGFLMHLGDVGSMFFILAIAAQTCFQVGMRRRLTHRWFIVSVLCISAFVILLTAIGPLMYGWNVYSSSGAWCWISQKHENLRLGTLYIWLFLIQSLCIIIYGGLWFKLSQARKNISLMNNSDMASDLKYRRAAMLMGIYPFVYLTLTLPLAATRMALYAHKRVPDWIYIMDGCLMTSCGWVDCILYVFTRRALLRDELKSPQASAAEARQTPREPYTFTSAAEVDMIKSIQSSSEDFDPEATRGHASSSPTSPQPYKPGFDDDIYEVRRSP